MAKRHAVGLNTNTNREVVKQKINKTQYLVASDVNVITRLSLRIFINTFNVEITFYGNTIKTAIRKGKLTKKLIIKCRIKTSMHPDFGESLQA